MSSPLSAAEAQQQVLDRIRPLPLELVETAAAAGRVLGEAACAAVDLPPFASSAMDGFAVRAGDVPGALAVVGRIAAGRPSARALGPGEAIGIATGGLIPAGADAVVPIEDVVERDNTVRVDAVVHAGENVRPRGGDVHAGEIVVPAGVRLAPAAIGALSAAGLAEVRCARRPVVALLATGTELVRPGTPLAPGQVYEANGAMLEAAAASTGAVAEPLPAVEDSEDAHRHALERGLAADVLVTTGGVSVGPHDLVRRILGQLGVEEVFWRVAVKPGRPVAFGVREDTLVFGLPGNPVSSLVGFELFVRPALLALQRAAEPLPRLERGRLACAVARNPSRDEFLRARMRVEGVDVVLEPLEGQESHMIGRAAVADALVLVPLGDGELAAGTAAGYLPLR